MLGRRALLLGRVLGRHVALWSSKSKLGRVQVRRNLNLDDVSAGVADGESIAVDDCNKLRCQVCKQTK